MCINQCNVITIDSISNQIQSRWIKSMQIRWSSQEIMFSLNSGVKYYFKKD